MFEIGRNHQHFSGSHDDLALAQEDPAAVVATVVIGQRMQVRRA